MMRPAFRRYLSLFWLLLLALAACTPAAPRIAATMIPTAAPLHWDERAAVTLIRADYLDLPLDDVEVAARVPRCAVFGDARARWVEPPDEADAARGALGRLMESPVDRERLDALAQQVADSGFFDLDTNYGPAEGPVRELYIRLEGMGQHTVQVADGTAPPAVFDDLYTLCESLRQPDEAQEIIPTGGWLYAFPQDAPGEYHTLWPEFDVPFLPDLAEQPFWFEGELVGQVWIAQRDHGARATFGDGENAYRVVVRVPGIAPDTPRRPRDPQEPLPPSTLWNPDPQLVVFEVRYSGGLPTSHRFIGANAVDACTIYGDGRVVISEQPIGAVQVGHLSESEMTGFLEGWLNTGFFEAAEAPDSSSTPTPTDLISEIVTITLIDGRTATGLYPTNTPYMRGVRNPCAGITDFAPAVPERGYVWAEPVGPMTRYENDLDYALVQWPEYFPPLNELPEPVWQEENEEAGTTTDMLVFAWDNIHGGHNRPTVLFVDGGIAYAVYVDVPGLTVRNAPLYTFATPTPTPPEPSPTVEDEPRS